MIATIVHVWIKPEFRQDFIEASLKNQRASINEKGNLRFDLIADEENENKFVFYEAYENEELALKHKNTDHYLEWRNTVEKMMAKPRKGVKYQILGI